MAWSELTSRRILTGKHWKDGNKGHFEHHSKTRLHYPTAGPDSLVLDGVINMTPVRVNNSQFDGWRVTANHWHYYLGKPKSGAFNQIDGVVGFGGRQGEHVLRFRLTRFGYLHYPTRAWQDIGGAPTYIRTGNLTSSTQSITTGPAGTTSTINTLTQAEWRKLWSLPDTSEAVYARWESEGRRLKGSYTTTQLAREWVVANRPPTTPANETYFGYVIRIDPNEIAKWIKNNIEQNMEGDWDDDDGTATIELRNAEGDLLALMPTQRVWSSGDLEQTITLRKRFWKDPDGNYYLLIGARCDQINNLPPGDLIFDPTFTDGYGGDVSTYKDTKFNPYSPANNYGAVNNYFTGSEGGGSGLIQFDASTIPAGSTCDDAIFYNYHMAVGTNMAWTTTVYSMAVGNTGWPEGTHENATGGAGDSCYDHLDQSPGTETNWHGSAGCNTSGEDYEASALGTFSGNRTDAIGTEYHVHLTGTRVDDWFGSPNTNYGLKLISATNDIGALCSSDYATTGYRPKLVVTYTEAASGVEVAPAAASAVGSRLGPTVVLGSLSLSPTARTAVSARLGPTVKLGNLAITPAARTAVSARLGPTLKLGNLAITPAARTAVAVSIDPTVITISILFTPDPASALSVSANPTVSFGSLSLLPTSSSSVSVSIPPAVLYGSTNSTPTPTASVAVTQSPTVVLGSITNSPTAGAAIGVSINPILIHGPISLEPVALSSVSYSIDPTILVLNLIAVSLTLRTRELDLTLLDRDTVDNTMHFLLPNGVNKWLFGDGSEIVQIDQCIHLSLNTRSLALTLQVRDAVYSLSHILLPDGVGKWLFGDGREIIFVDEGIHLTLLPRNLTLTLGAHE